MRTFAILGMIFPKDVGQSLFDRLVSAHPEGMKNRGFLARLYQDDPRYEQLLSMLADSGYLPRARFSRDRHRSFGLKLLYEYEVTEIEAEDYLVPEPINPVGEVAGRNDRGLFKLHGRGLGGHSDIGFNVGATIVTDRLKLAIEQGGLRGPTFKETEMSGRTARPPIWPFWELTSDIILPNLSPSCTLMTNQGQPFDGDLNKGCFLVEGHYSNPEYHYRASDLRSVEPFDLALTCERFGNVPHAAWPVQICSKRFYEFCRERNLPMNWQPVRIDPD